jgi:hypothetical protein
MKPLTVWLRNPRTVGTCSCCDSEARLTPGGWVHAESEQIPARPRRAAGHGAGLDGPICPERAQRDQVPAGQRSRMCIRCGRITALVDTDGTAWCGGTLSGEHPQPAGRTKRHLTLVSA